MKRIKRCRKHKYAFSFSMGQAMYMFRCVVCERAQMISKNNFWGGTR